LLLCYLQIVCTYTDFLLFFFLFHHCSCSCLPAPTCFCFYLRLRFTFLQTCPAGKYGELLGQISEMKACTSCRAGTFRTTPGANHISNCLPCETGKYQLADRPRTMDCVSCEPGTFSEFAAATSECKECPAGFSQGGSASPNCQPCLPGEFQSQPKKQSCNECDFGEFSKQLSTTQNPVINCKSCPSGYSQPEKKSASCLPCK
jgi:hypothetical protein